VHAHEEQGLLAGHTQAGGLQTLKHAQYTRLVIVMSHCAALAQAPNCDGSLPVQLHDSIGIVTRRRQHLRPHGESQV
jgi:hypothetical protein